VAVACVTATSDDLEVGPSAETTAQPTAAAASAEPGAVETSQEGAASGPPAEPEPADDKVGDEPIAATGDIAGPEDVIESEAEVADAAAEATIRTEPAIGYISLDESQAFVQIISGGVREAAAEAGIELIECDSSWTRPGVLECAVELATEGVSGVISMQPFPDLNEAVCEALADTPTIGIVYDQGPCQVALFEIDQAESGRLAGSALGALAAKRFECEVKAYVSLESGVSDVIGGARMEGYREGYQEHCPLPEQSITLNDAQHLVTARTQFADVLEDVKGKPIMVAGVSEDAVLGAMSAAAKRDRANHVWLSGQLADPVIRQTIACDNHYVASVAQFPERFGDTVVPAMVDLIGGEPVPSQLLAELELVTAQNVRELFPDTPACDE
jgi:ribose transport system substrate-binding protein